MEKSITLMSAFGDEKLNIEKLDDGSLMVEVEGQIRFTSTKASVVLDETGRKRLMKFLEPVNQDGQPRSCDTCYFVETIPSIEDPCYSCNEDYDKWEERRKSLT
jgi:hypothetical protein